MTTSAYTTLTGLARVILPDRLEDRLRSFVRSRRDRRMAALAERRAAYWEANAGKAESVSIRLQPGVDMEVYFDSDLGRLIYLGWYELGERYFLNAFLRRGDIYIDVGANLGLFSVIAAERVGRHGRVHAIEPCSRTFARLARNISLNGFENIIGHRLALSAENGESEMTLSTDGHDAWNSLAPPTDGNVFARETVRTQKWDAFVEENKLIGKVAMMKVDVEGWEMHFLAGASDSLSRDDAPVLQVEFNDEALTAAGSTGRDLHTALTDLGYNLFSYDWGTRELVPETIRDEYPYVNLIAAKDPEAVTERLWKGRVPRWIR